MSLLTDDVKIDSAATEGLSGTQNSLAYRVEEIEKHLHNNGKWVGAAASPSGETHVADRMAGGISAFQLTSGNDTFGSWVQIMGSSDTPIYTGMAYFDPHLILVTTTSSTSPFNIQFVSGESSGIAAKIAAEDFWDIAYISPTVNNDSGITGVLAPRITATTKLWARCVCVGQDAKTIDFYYGLHEYIG